MKTTQPRLAAVAALTSGAVAITCDKDSLQSAFSSIATVDFATWMPANSTFNVPKADIAYSTAPTQLRAACAVQVSVKNGTSNYGFGVFLPDDWNGRFLAVGNGGFAGGINWLDMGAGLGYGFAVMSTDTGHNSVNNNGSWAYHNEGAILDWGYRAMHGSTVLGKQLTTAYYSNDILYSYYSGCSTGGRQGLRNLQLFPDDFDGVVAGAPAWWTNHLQPWTAKVGSYNLPNTSVHHIPPTLFPAIGAEVMRQCDGADGVVDTIISDPEACDFNPDLLLCTPSKNTSCLTVPQLNTLHQIYSDYVDTNQTFVFSHLWMGSEAQWVPLLGLNAPNNLGPHYVQYFLQRGPEWQWQDFDYGVIQQADAQDPGNATADDFDLSPFMERGGKLLHYHGMGDGLIPTGSSVYLHSQIFRTLAPKGVDLDSFYRFFLVPGMQHCTNTATTVNAPWYFAGANQAATLSSSVSGVPGFRDAKHDVLLAMMAWVENGTAPAEIIATKWVNDTLQDKVMRQRPLCMWPKKQKWSGQGDVNAAETWSCV
ncbi:putative ferulic acid Esterase/Feruloyl esterase [Aureobasidium pullulans]|nr:putative ferulic acid Esterase/Feruloyl esterase [Aureobasidium pullulans]